ncbi:MAG: glutamate formimidoyltransferase [Candidatus Rokubacteria bacterium]|nr:glutamate formimidoyltransferase [Candidatus Rokubacteria bacterium]
MRACKMRLGLTRAILECVPNVSEGRDRRAVEGFAAAVGSVAGVRLADLHMDPDHHRSVLTFLGAPEAVERAALALAEAVLSTIDMTTHQGVHPRMGALDVLPFVPLREMTMGETAELARRVGRRLAERFDLPVYFYAEAALSPERQQLSPIRRGQYEGLAQKLADPAWRPDAGPARFNPRSGATAVGARGILVAFNVWLDTKDLDAARDIARIIRESSGGLPGIQAMGVPLPRRGIVQVSLNLLDYQRASIPRVFGLIQAEAARRGVTLMRGELVGLAPRLAFEGRSPESVGLTAFTPAKLLETYLPDDPTHR